MANILDSFDKIRSTLDRESITSIMNPFLILSIASTNWECLWTCPQLFSSSFVFRFQTIKVLNSNIIFKSKHLLVLKLFSNWDSNWFYSLFPIFDISSTIPIYYQIVIDPAHSPIRMILSRKFGVSYITNFFSFRNSIDEWFFDSF